MTIYERIRGIVKERGLTITGMEKELGFARGSLCKIDTSKPSAERLQKLSDYLGVTTGYILKGEESDSYYLNDETKEIAQEIFENKELKMLFDASRNASPEDLKTVHDMMLALKRKEQGE